MQRHIEYNSKKYYWDGHYYTKWGHKRLHRQIYIDANGEIPTGYHVHHKDFDKHNNRIENLVLLSPSEHAKIHNAYEKKYNYKKYIENKKRSIGAAQEKAKLWHASKEGLAWHSINGKNAWVNRKPKILICINCKKEHESFFEGKTGNHYCSNKCCTAYRVKRGIDDIKSICKGCSKEFKTNKYLPRKYCSKDCRKTNGIRINNRRRA